VNTWEQLKQQLTSYYRPLHQELRAREALHLLRQRGSVEDYAKSFNNLIIKVPGMTLEEKLYIFINGLKTNIQISVAMQPPPPSNKQRSWPPVLMASSAINVVPHPPVLLSVMVRLSSPAPSLWRLAPSPNAATV
jgi:Retrotransposon gag protein